MEKIFFILVVLFSKLGFAGIAENLKSPLIIGASVSADFMSDSPGKILASKYTSTGNIKKIAKWGAGSSEILDRIKERHLKNSTSIIGLDFLFWDSVNSSVSEASKNIVTLIAMAKQKNIPVIIGDIPNLLSGQNYRSGINTALRSHCASYSKCKIFGLSQLYAEVTRNKGLTIRGKFVQKDELLPDGLHLSRIASEEIARRLAPLLQ